MFLSFATAQAIFIAITWLVIGAMIELAWKWVDKAVQERLTGALGPASIASWKEGLVSFPAG